MEHHGEHGVVSDGGAADGLAARAGGFVAFEGAVAAHPYLRRRELPAK
ncbi:hypothetical protein [Streptomyces sp. NPDC000405]